LAYNFKNVRVLIVESSPELYKLFRAVLNIFTVPERNVESAYSMEEGFEKFTAGNHDLVIVDWLQTPDRGIELVRQIRMSGRSPNPFVPIIMTAGSGHENRVKRARDAGVSEYLVKPFTANTLARKIERIVENPRQFVVSDAYVGPDRRAPRAGGYTGPERRQQAARQAESTIAGAIRQKDPEEKS
jgi:two-component system, chemotaxis family, chemotaxis protein CheY